MQKTQRQRCDGGGGSDEYVGIVDSGGAPIGVIHLVGGAVRQKMLGPVVYSAQELAAVAELGKHVGAFLDTEPLRSQMGSR
jgi:hypothetical protein